MNSSISVILPYYNGSKFVTKAIESVLNQTLAPLELIVINDGSTPDEARFLDQFKSKWIVIINKSNAGVSSARNLGINKASGEWIAFIDQDDQWEITKLERQCDYLHDNPHCRALHTAVKGIKANGQISEYRKRPLTKDDFLTTFPCPAYLSSTIIAKSLLMRAGLFNTKLHYSQDCECFLRCAMIAPFHYLDDVLTVRLNHNSNLSGDSSGVWRDRVSIIRQYHTEFDSPSTFRRTLHSIHGIFALLAFHQRNWNLFFRIIAELRNERFSKSFFICSLIHKKFAGAQP